jgi:hypothetical protein
LCHSKKTKNQQSNRQHVSILVEVSSIVNHFFVEFQSMS